MDDNNNIQCVLQARHYTYFHDNVEYDYFIYVKENIAKVILSNDVVIRTFYLIVNFTIKRRFLFFKFNHHVTLDTCLGHIGGEENFNSFKRIDSYIRTNSGVAVFSKNKIRNIVLQLITKYYLKK